MIARLQAGSHAAVRGASRPQVSSTGEHRSRKGDAPRTRRSLSDGDGFREGVRRGGARGVPESDEARMTMRARFPGADRIRHVRRDDARGRRRAQTPARVSARLSRSQLRHRDRRSRLGREDPRRRHADGRAHRLRADTLALDLLDLTVARVTVNGRAAKFRADAGIRRRRSAARERRRHDDGRGGLRRRGHRRSDRAARQRGAVDVLRRQLAEPRATLDSESRSSERQGDGDVARACVAAARRSWRTARSCRRGRWPMPRGGARTESVWRESQPIPVYLMVIAAAPLERYDLGETACGLGVDRQCVPQYVYTAPEQAKTMPGPFARAGDIVALFSRLVGPFPYEKLAHLQSSTRYGGMENASEIFYADGAFRRGTMNDELIAHETAHQWFGDAVTERAVVARLALGRVRDLLRGPLGARGARRLARSARECAPFARRCCATRCPSRGVRSSTRSKPPSSRLLNRNSYEKGGFVLHMLRAQVGDSAFFRALRAYYAEHRNSTALTDDLQAAMEKTSGQKLDWFFDQWLRRPGYPEIDARWRYDRQTHEAVIDVRQSGAVRHVSNLRCSSASSIRSAASIARCCRFRRHRRALDSHSRRRRCRLPCCSTRTSRSSPTCESPRPRPVMRTARTRGGCVIALARRVASSRRRRSALKCFAPPTRSSPRASSRGPNRRTTPRRERARAIRSLASPSAIFSSSAARRGSAPRCSRNRCSSAATPCSSAASSRAPTSRRASSHRSPRSRRRRPPSASARSG